MTDSTHTLEMRWLPVVDAQGREHMECVWIAPDALASTAAQTPHAA